ncbi:hypothetical protein [Arsenophonus endosymbiont of Aleurodicus floccissimus]|uniref:hypothetical protein n=1 Tax=Arsenophonus endosymbiont of Aleurodicus floccissimus TaxID=2152761 RepID=UPI0011C49D54|nr:hypothetical protein [Arsenophonus endosymbiont of Aleurodicus floccissimus]
MMAVTREHNPYLTEFVIGDNWHEIDRLKRFRPLNHTDFLKVFPELRVIAYRKGQVTQEVPHLH